MAVGKLLLSELAPLVTAQQGAVYQMQGAAGDAPGGLVLLAGYATADDQIRRIDVGRGLVGQCALEKQRILLTQVPDGYARVESSLGSAPPANTRSRPGWVAMSSLPSGVWAMLPAERDFSPLALGISEEAKRDRVTTPKSGRGIEDGRRNFAPPPTDCICAYLIL